MKIKFEINRSVRKSDIMIVLIPTIGISYKNYDKKVEYGIGIVLFVISISLSLEREKNESK